MFFYREHGNNNISKLGDHFFGEADAQQLSAEWGKAKYDMASWKAEVPGEIKNGIGAVTATEWCLKRVLNPFYKSSYPMLAYVAEVCISTPVSNAWPERGASILKWQKSRLRARIKNDLLGALMMITINCPKLVPQALSDGLINEAVEKWVSVKKRKKLPKKETISAQLGPNKPETGYSHSDEGVDAIAQATVLHEDSRLDDYISALKLPDEESSDDELDSECDF